MTRSRLLIGMAVAALALAACHRKADDPVAVTADEQSQLNDAAASLDANAVSANDADADADTNTEDPL